MARPRTQHTIRNTKIVLQLFPILLVVAVIFIGIFNLQTVRDFFTQATGQSASILIDNKQELGPLPRPWRNLAQGGEDHNWDIQPIAGKVRTLRPEYIRIDHIYDFYEIVQKQDGQLTFNFSKLDKVLDGITATGAKPFISLSYMPPAITQTDIIGQPHNWNDWQLTIQRTIEHISGARGISDVYYEVWNEPDLFGDWKTYGDKNYLTMYTYASRGAQQARGVRPFKFGGPGITALYKNWFDRLTKHALDNNLRYDFFSWHRYNRKLEQFEQDLTSVQNWQTAFPTLPENFELLITETGHDPAIDTGYDTNFSGVHTAATSIISTGILDRLFIFEIEDGKDPAGKERWGRWGLLTHQSFGAQPKPRYQALRMLDQLSDTQLLLLGEGTWVKGLATRNENQIDTILVNYDSSWRNSEVVPVTYSNIIPGEYTINQTFLGGRQNTQTIATTAGVLQTSVTMPTNSMVFVELIPNFDIEQVVEPVVTIPPAEVTVPPQRTGFGRILEQIREQP